MVSIAILRDAKGIEGSLIQSQLSARAQNYLGLPVKLRLLEPLIMETTLTSSFEQTWSNDETHLTKRTSIAKLRSLTSKRGLLDRMGGMLAHMGREYGKAWVEDSGLAVQANRFSCQLLSKSPFTLLVSSDGAEEVYPSEGWPIDAQADMLRVRRTYSEYMRIQVVLFRGP